ncbi:MAG: glycosyltransferase [Candidatus Methanomethylophilaceae archaeon]|nr:glycosyltransferase [Candidatus Methanomethylophilaceae archaeon]
MRIAFVTDSYHPTIDGVVTIVDSIRDSLVALGHEVVIVAPDPGEVHRIEGVYYFPAVSFPMYKGYYLPILPSNKLEILKEIDPDVIHGYGIAFMALKGYICAHEMKIPYVLTMTTMVTDTMEFYLPKFLPLEPTEKLAWIYIREILNHSDAVITHTEPIMEELRSHGVDPRHVGIIPAGVETEIFRPIEGCTSIKDELGILDKRVIMHVGRISYEKHIDDIVRSLALLPDDVVMIIVGDGPARADVENTVNGCGFQDRVFFTGFVDKHRLPEYYNSADVCVSCSRFETQGLSIMEAMACRKPIVCPNARAFSVIIEDGKDGFLFDGGVEDMAEKINIALECDDSIRQAAMEKAQSYSKENCARMLLDLYDYVVDAKRKRLASKQKKHK